MVLRGGLCHLWTEFPEPCVAIGAALERMAAAIGRPTLIATTMRI